MASLRGDRRCVDGAFFYPRVALDHTIDLQCLQSLDPIADHRLVWQTAFSRLPNDVPAPRTLDRLRIAGLFDHIAVGRHNMVVVVDRDRRIGVDRHCRILDRPRLD